MIKGLAVALGTVSLAISQLAMAQTTPSPTTPADASTGPVSTSSEGAAQPARNDNLPMRAQSQAVSGWSIKEQVLGKNVKNEMDEKIGDVRDVILDPSGKATHYIIGAGGFLGMGEHDVAIPFDRVKVTNDEFLLNGYTKEELKALPKAKID